MPEPTVVDRFLDAVCAADIDRCDAWSSGATLDATVPNWRFRRVGPDEIRETYRGWFADRGKLEQLRRHPIAGGEVVEYLLTWTEDDVPHAAHHLHLLDIVDDRIVADVVMCGGRWPASLLAEMEETASA